jgi:acyl-CoA thioester hydrolase
VKDRSFGLTPPGLGWMLVRLDIHFRAELRWPGSIEMGLGVAKFGRTSLTFDQVVFSDRKCVASAQSVTVLIDENTRKPTPLTGEIIGNFQRWLRRGVEGARSVATVDGDRQNSPCGGFKPAAPASRPPDRRVRRSP